MSRRLVSLTAALVVCASCAPRDPIQLGMKEYSTDIVFGRQSPPPPPPPPIAAAEPAPGFPSFIVPPPPAAPAGATASPSTTSASRRSRPAAPPCPPDDPFVFPEEPATPGVLRPPSAGPYVFRQKGEVTVSGTTTPLPAASIRRIGDVVGTPPGDVRYDVTIESLGDTTTTTYQVRQSTRDPSIDGVFITRVVTRRASGKVDEFAPVNGVRIISLPAAPGATWNDVGTDPARATSMVVQGTVEAGKARVNACGTPLDAWAVKVSGRLLGPGKDLALSASYAVGTQLGGFVLREEVTLSGTDDGRSLRLSSSATISAPRPGTAR